MIPKLLTVEEVAGILGVQPRVIRRRINAGTIKATKYPGRSGGEYRIAETDLQEYIDSMG
jgi:excisionase family DNA binding protein